MTWGLGLWGLGPFGSLSSAISVASALASSTNTVRVTLTNLPQEIDATANGDVLNTATWLVTRLDTGQVFTVLQVRPFDEPYTFELDLLEPLGNYRITHRVQSSTLLSSAGILISAPKSADFAGVVVSVAPPLSTPQRSYTSVDLANPPAPQGLDSLGGTLIIDANSDYRNEDGASLLRKLIIRRLVTVPGEFFHLPTYGVGITVKEPLRGGDIIKLQKLIEQQVLLEPDVESVQAQVSLSRSSGILTLKIKALQRKNGEAVEIGLQVPPPGVVQL